MAELKLGPPKNENSKAKTLKLGQCQSGDKLGGERNGNQAERK
jgi:hypothetical protein